MADNLPSFSASPADGNDDGAYLKHYHERWVVTADSANATFDAPAAYRAPVGHRNLVVYGQIKTTFSGNNVSTLEIGVNGDANLHGAAAALTAGTQIIGKTATMPDDVSSAHTPRVTCDQIPTAGVVVVHVEYDLPVFPLTFA